MSLQVSVVIPTRNRPRHVIALLESLAKQRNGGGLSWETILVDDAGEKSTRTAIEKYLNNWAASPVRLYVLERRGGVSRARNTGVRLSQGEVIAFLDDDILAERTFLAETARAHAERSEVLVLNGKLRRLRDDYYSRFWNHHYSAAFDRALTSPYHINRVASGFFSVKRALLDKVPLLFDEALPSREDFDLLLRLRAQAVEVWKHDSIVGYHDFRTNLSSLIRQRLWYETGEVALRRKHGEAVLHAFYRSEKPPARPWKFLPLYASIHLSRSAYRAWRALW